MIKQVRTYALKASFKNSAGMASNEKGQRQKTQEVANNLFLKLVAIQQEAFSLKFVCITQ
jgi:hypothetical protein